MDSSQSNPFLQSWLSHFSDPSKWQPWANGQSFTEKADESGASGNAASNVMFDPMRMAGLQSSYMHEFFQLWQQMLTSKPPHIHDKRFSSAAWRHNPYYAYNAAIYLLNARFMLESVDAMQATAKEKQKIRFALQQVIDALSPANFLATNPDAQHKFIETQGESALKGMMHMLNDLQKGRISQTDESAFEVGKNIAITEGAVVFENDLFQLIQYKPLTETVYQRPLLIVPPCINKYYILDLQPGNSLVRYTVEQGHTVFLISWRNADESMHQKTWEDYIREGALKAIEVTQKISGLEKINALGFCIGGTILATALALLFARGEKPIASLTLLTTLLDYSDAGALEVYIDELQVQTREKTIGQSGLMPGQDFITAFSSLRANDLIWNYVESNYLKGETPPAFDLLFWNSDCTNLPGPMFCWYLRNLYLENRLKQPNDLSVGDETIDLGKIDVPAFVYASREDHIVPWKTAYTSAELINVKNPSHTRFVLGASGHIAGVINPPAKKKRTYWINSAKEADPDRWFEDAVEHAGSWWPEWSVFLEQHAGKRVPAPNQYGNLNFWPIEPAPGKYVKVKAA